MAGELEGVEWRYDPAIVAANQFLQMAAERSVVSLSQATELLIADISQPACLDMISAISIAFEGSFSIIGSSNLLAKITLANSSASTAGLRPVVSKSPPIEQPEGC